MKKRVLYAEDNAEVRGVLCRVLSHLGWQVTSESHGEAALDRFRANEFDVVITDHRMPPGSGGLTLVESLRARGFSGRIYVISGALPEADRDRYRELNVDGIVTKPVAISQLQALLGAA